MTTQNVTERIETLARKKRADAARAIKKAARAHAAGKTLKEAELQEVAAAMESFGLPPAEFDAFANAFRTLAAEEAALKQAEELADEGMKSLARADELKEKIEALQKEEREARRVYVVTQSGPSSVEQRLRELRHKFGWLFSDDPDALPPAPAADRPSYFFPR